MPVRDEIGEAIEEAIKDSVPSPSNEQETCYRIIDPLLSAVGYRRVEIKIQDKDHAGQKPDYTILPDDQDHTWFLEAKAWNVALDDNHANQAVNYANTQGKRWVALSNGREWRLYDNHIIGRVEDKTVCTVHLKDSEFASFLEAIAKSSVQQERLESFVQNRRLYSYLSQQFASPKSEVIKAVTKVVKATQGLTGATPEDVVGFLRDHAAFAETSTSVESLKPASVPEPNDRRPTPPRLPEGKLYRLDKLTADNITGNKVRCLVLPDGSRIQLTTWRGLTCEVARYALENGTALAVPFFAGSKGKRLLIARLGTPEAESMRASSRLPFPHDSLLIETNLSAGDQHNASVCLLRTVGIEPATFQVEI